MAKLAQEGELSLHSSDEKTDKATIFQKEFDELMKEYQFTDDPKAIALREKVVEWLRFPSRDLVVPGFSDGVGKLMSGVSEIFDNQQLKEKVNQLILDMAQLKEDTTRRIEKLEQENDSLQKRLSSLEDEKAEKSLNIAISDLGRMYRKYVIVPLLPNFLGSHRLPLEKQWGEFCKEFRGKEADVDENKITSADFDKWLLPLSSRLTIDVKLLMSRTKQRNLDSHDDITSIPKQTAFLAKISSMGVQGSCGKLLCDMVRALQDPSIKLTRMRE